MRRKNNLSVKGDRKMLKGNKNKYSMGVYISLSIGSVLYLIFTKWVFLAVGLICGIMFLIKGFASK